MHMARGVQHRRQVAPNAVRIGSRPLRCHVHHACRQYREKEQEMEVLFCGYIWTQQDSISPHQSLSAPKQLDIDKLQ